MRPRVTTSSALWRAMTRIGAGRAAAQERVVGGGDLPRRNVRGAVAAEEVPLHGLKARVRQAMPEEAAHEQQQVQVAIQGGRNAAAHAIARLEERPVERAAVVGDQAGARRNLAGQGIEQRRLLREIREEQLHEAHPIALPPADADHERHRSGRRAQAGRLGIEAEQGSARSRHPPEVRRAGSDRWAGTPAAARGGRTSRDLFSMASPSIASAMPLGQRCRGSTAPVPCQTGCGVEYLSPAATMAAMTRRISGSDSPARSARSTPSDSRRCRRMPSRRRWSLVPSTVTRPPPARQRGQSPAGGLYRSAGGAGFIDQGIEQPAPDAFASTSGSSRGPVQAGQPLSQPQPAIRSAAPAISSSWRSKSRSDRPTPPGTASYR
jgi:hypothetical protein